MTGPSDCEDLGLLICNWDFRAAPINLRHPPASGQIQTIPKLIDYNATVNPDTCYCVQAVKPVGAKARDRVIFTMR